MRNHSAPNQPNKVPMIKDHLNRIAELFSSKPTMTVDEIRTIIHSAAGEFQENIQEWSVDEEELQVCLDMLPEAGSHVSHEEWGTLVLEIQKRFLVDRFLKPFDTKLYEIRDQANALDFDDWNELSVQIAIVRTQTIQLLSMATQSLISAARQYEMDNQIDEIAEDPEPVEEKSEIQEVGETQFEDPRASEIPAWLLGGTSGEA